MPLEPGQLPDFLKDAAAQGAVVFTVTQIVKDLLQRFIGDVDSQTTRGIALCLSVLVAAGVFAPVDANWPRWWLNVFGYATVVIMPLALAGHLVSRLGAPRPDVVAKRQAARQARQAREVKPGNPVPPR